MYYITVSILIMSFKMIFYSLSLALQPFGPRPRPLFQFLNPIHRYDSLDGVSARCKAAAYTQNKRTQASMPRVGFELTTPVL
jgi:hypothetical protein